MLDFPSESEDRTSNYDEQLSRVCYYISSGTDPTLATPLGHGMIHSQQPHFASSIDMNQQQQPPPLGGYDYSSKPSFRLKESEEYDQVIRLTRKCTLLAVGSWLFCCGCFYSCFCFLPLIRKNFIFHNHECSFLEDARWKYVRSFRGNRYKDSPYRRVRKIAERAIEFGFVGCCAANVLILFWVFALGIAALVVTMVMLFGYTR
ncbi:hypothetical protein C9374_012895 [Naegleria lovaniensis]|uniref:Uncharacterized protein n=1 Tax=Naegleria lovaniensis TaxID=51637 RepID=A0AA88GEC6_NAELO|nr:uncharacterized protein C9374_012895 [Naegleria lovaniensis]KAG2373049.1 hypothetical protein C9374_012895 [Naegleria lovaniensis]